VGTAAAVVPLREAEARDPSLRSPSRQAIAEIQARLGGAAPGQLSLAGGEAGQLSMVEDDETGRLSLSDEARPDERRMESSLDASNSQRSAGRLKTAQ
jgi:hypothetical protein